MKNLIRHKVIFATIFMFISSFGVSAEQLLPLPKPVVDQETKKKTEKRKIIYPQAKPSNKNIITKVEESADAENLLKKETYIYPRKKPINIKKIIKKDANK